MGVRGHRVAERAAYVPHRGRSAFGGTCVRHESFGAAYAVETRPSGIGDPNASRPTAGRFTSRIAVAARKSSKAKRSSPKAWRIRSRCSSVDPATGEPRLIQSADPQSIDVRMFALAPRRSLARGHEPRIRRTDKAAQRKQRRDRAAANRSVLDRARRPIDVSIQAGRADRRRVSAVVRGRSVLSVATLWSRTREDRCRLVALLVARRSSPRSRR